jgi:hypothetical protein
MTKMEVVKWWNQLIKLRVDGSKFTDKIKRAVESIVDVSGRMAAERLLSAVVANTPVDTGYARSRWTLQKPDAYTVRYSVSTPGLFTEFKFVLSNDAPYIVYLNRGSSKQAPAYFIESTIMSQGFRLTSAV